MFRIFANSFRRLAMPVVAVGLTLASTNSASAQGFRHPGAFHHPVGFHRFPAYFPQQMGINLYPRGLSPATNQYLQSTRNNIALRQAATYTPPYYGYGLNTRGLPGGTLQYIQAQRNNFATNSAAARLVNAQGPNNAVRTSALNFANFNARAYNPLGYYNPYFFGANFPYVQQPIYQPYYQQPYSYGSGYGSGLNYASSGYGAPTSSAPSSPAPAPAPRVASAVTTLGVATNDDGSIAWPFAFRLMAPDAKRELLDPLAGQLEIVANQSARGKANPNIVRESQLGVDRLYQWLRTHRLDLAEGSVRDANQFLGRIDAALRAMRTDV